MYDSIRPGRVAIDPVVTDIRALLYEPAGPIKYKLSYDDDYVLLPKRPKPRSTLLKPKLYQSRIPISQIKLTHLQELKHVKSAIKLKILVKAEEEEHVDDPEDGHAVARDPDQEEHDQDDVDTVARACGPHPTQPHSPSASSSPDRRSSSRTSVPAVAVYHTPYFILDYHP
ncbi:unnamed protein product [Euphydryas editha]|uniref:Uncharacterized protein n=1 Tax=Euphydryas editha TaxID=104508 RepID=A0AAU9TQM1_EUPED|nr:unnamed protein product [Euphydryas editha]